VKAREKESLQSSQNRGECRSSPLLKIVPLIWNEAPMLKYGASFFAVTYGKGDTDHYSRVKWLKNIMATTAGVPALGKVAALLGFVFVIVNCLLFRECSSS
jgi:hypothetical protein